MEESKKSEEEDLQKNCMPKMTDSKLSKTSCHCCGADISSENYKKNGRICKACKEKGKSVEYV